jgi:probable rRNA maturation factor
VRGTALQTARTTPRNNLLAPPMIVNRQRRIALAIRPLSDFLERAQRELGFPESAVTVRLISDSAMAQLNRRFRGKSGPTDVLSFPANTIPPRRSLPRRTKRSNGNGTKDSDYVGDIALSPETARRNARRYSRSLPAELRILVLHGLIHLAGFDHETDQGQMARLERRLRRRLDLETS